MGRISPDIRPGYPVFKVPETWAGPGAEVSCILWLKLAFRWQSTVKKTLLKSGDNKRNPIFQIERLGE